MVNLTLRVLSRPEVNRLPDIFKTLGLEYDEKVLPSIGNEGRGAEQETERSKFVVAKAEQERMAAIIRAEGESESAKLISDATAAAGMGLIELRRIDTSRENTSTMSKNPNLTRTREKSKKPWEFQDSIFGFISSSSYPSSPYVNP
ncbi:Prohibitin-3 [Forsythia ovata]|uniref:Prohibitin n=1 Tax=Forsythia ovata TaxID=205694 RepID=A0ABD1UAN8_9LAMI